jgi:hypothetical protein
MERHLGWIYRIYLDGSILVTNASWRRWRRQPGLKRAGAQEGATENAEAQGFTGAVGTRLCGPAAALIVRDRRLEGIAAAINAVLASTRSSVAETAAAQRARALPRDQQDRPVR